MRVDFHTHSKTSDGTYSPAALARMTRSFAAAALTDHDTCSGAGEFLAEPTDGPCRRFAGDVGVHAAVDAQKDHFRVVEFPERRGSGDRFLCVSADLRGADFAFLQFLLIHRIFPVLKFEIPMHKKADRKGPALRKGMRTFYGMTMKEKISAKMAQVSMMPSTMR